MEEFLSYLKNEERKADNTVLAYKKDLRSFQDFLARRNGRSLLECADSDAASYMLQLGREKKSRATMNRKLSSLKSFYDFKLSRGACERNPFKGIKSMKIGTREIDYLMYEQIEELLALPDDSLKGLRDRALMEFMYGTGIRVTELVRLKVSDINLRMKFVSVGDARGDNRIIPIGRYLEKALAEYFRKAYPELANKAAEPDDYAFINMRGEALTRQGVWRILKEYGEKIDLADRMTPQILRDSFAIHILQNGGDLKTIQELMGFDDMSIGIAYLSFVDIHIKDVFNRTHPRA